MLVAPGGDDGFVMVRILSAHSTWRPVAGVRTWMHKDGA